MPATYTPLGASRLIRNRFNRLPESLRQAEAFSARRTYDAALAQSRGSASLATLARVSPFALWHGSPQLDPNVINVHAGLFLQSWRLEGPEELAGALVSRIWNDAPFAPFLETGTRFAFARAPHVIAAQMTAPLRARQILFAIQQTFRI